MFDKLRFLLKSKNRHGVHSPFVYQLNDECFNDSRYYGQYKSLKKTYPDIAHFLKKKRLRLLVRLMWHLKLTTYAVISKEKKYSSWKSDSKYDLILITDVKNIGLKEVLNSMQPHSVLIVQNIYKKNQSFWKEIQNCPNIHVTIDTYYQGFAFLRKEQMKEHFTIRV